LSRERNCKRIRENVVIKIFLRDLYESLFETKLE
jgi:hypothetical protein